MADETAAQAAEAAGAQAEASGTARVRGMGGGEQVVEEFAAHPVLGLGHGAAQEQQQRGVQARAVEQAPTVRDGDRPVAGRVPASR